MFTHKKLKVWWEIEEKNKIINKEHLHLSVNVVLPCRTEVLYLSGSSLAMENLDLHFLKTGLVNLFQVKPTTRGKLVNTHQPRTFQMWRSIKYKYHLQVLPKMFLLINSSTVDNLLLAKTSFITFVIIYKWRVWHSVLRIFKIPRLVQCSFFFPHHATELGKININLIVYWSIFSLIILFNNLQTCWDSKYQF